MTFDVLLFLVGGGYLLYKPSECGWEANIARLRGAEIMDQIILGRSEFPEIILCIDGR